MPKSQNNELLSALRHFVKPIEDPPPAKRATGPVTPEGKQRASLNSLKHGFTAQCVILSGDETLRYKSHLAAYMAEHQPAGPTETFLVETLAEISWTVSRIRAQEQNYMTLVGQTAPLPADSHSPEYNVAFAQAKNLNNEIANIDLLSRYELRKMRLFRETLCDLIALQANRRPQQQLAAEPPATTASPDATATSVPAATPEADVPAAAPAGQFVCPAPKTMTARTPSPAPATPPITPKIAA